MSSSRASDMTTKQQILEMIERLPDDISGDDAIEAIRLFESVRIGLEQVAAGEVVPHEDVIREFSIKR